MLCHEYSTPFPLGKWRHALVPDVTDGMSYWVVSLSNVAQVLSVSYRAGFGHWNKVGLVTANSPSTVVSPPKIWADPEHNCGGTVSVCLLN